MNCFQTNVITSNNLFKNLRLVPVETNNFKLVKIMLAQKLIKSFSIWQFF